MKNRFDYETTNLIGEVKYKLRAVSPIRSSVFQLANELADKEARQGFILLVDSSISEARINEEWSIIQNTLHPGIAKRLHIYLKRGDRFWGWPSGPDDRMLMHLANAIKLNINVTGLKLPKTDYFSVILKILLISWLGPSSKKPEKLTMRRIGDLAGCSYPTVASSVDRLSPYLLHSYSDGVQLKRFPFDEWHSMILRADKIRATKWLVDRSGKPRRLGSLKERLARMQLKHVGIGGVSGATAAFPDLDITADSRLDLCIHAPGNLANIDFVQDLDPALELTHDRQESARVVLHFVRSNNNFFAQEYSGIKTASWVECMLDLHEVRFGTQANQWLNTWINEKGGSID